MYLGELAPRNLRGAIGIVPQLFITVGILTAQVFGIRNILGNAEGKIPTRVVTFFFSSRLLTQIAVMENSTK